MDRELLDVVCARLQGQKILILDNADHLVFETFDCDGVSDESCIWLYKNDVAFAFVEVDAIIAVTAYPWQYGRNIYDDGATVGRIDESP